MTNYLSIDLESWAYPDLPHFRALTSAARKQVDAGFVRDSAEDLLERLARHNTRLTFFVVGQIYEWYPEVVERLAAAGHEIGYHTHTHDILHTPEALVGALRNSRPFLERFKPVGFRAPTILIREEYLRILHDHGFRYDSSTYAPYAARRDIGGVEELPVTAVRGVPLGSGYFVGLLGRFVGALYRRVNRAGDPVIAFLHNWQIVRPRGATFPTASYLLTHPQYLPYTACVAGTFERLLRDFTFAPMRDLLAGGDDRGNTKRVLGR